MNKQIMMLVVVTLSYLFCQCDKNVKKDVENSEEEEKNRFDLIVESWGRRWKSMENGEGCFPDVMDKYSYPIKNEVEKWVKMFPEEQLNECQLPDSLLKSISTPGLIRSFTDTPYSIEYLFLYSSSMQGATARRIHSKFNCLQELLVREDAVESLISFYAAITLDCYVSYIDCWKSYKDCYYSICGSLESTECFELLDDCFKILDDCWAQSEFSYRLMTLEYLFTTPEILDNISQEDTKMAVEILLAKHWQWFQLTNNDSNVPLIVMVWLMYDDMLPYFDKEILDSLKENVLNNEDRYILDDIITFAEKFILT